LNGIETATSSLNSFTSSINTTIKSKLNSDGVISGSSQITFGSISGVPSGLVSGSSQITYGSISGIPSGIVSGSSQISFGGISGVPGGLVSGSSQIDLTATTNYASGIKTRLDAVGVVSGSAQVTNIANSQLTNSSFYVGTTSISLGRASASQTLTGVSIDGNAGTATSAGVIATPTYNNGTTFNTLFTGLTSNTSKTYIIYNSTDQPLGTGLYNVIMHKFDANYGSYMAMNTEPNTGNLYLKQLYNGTWGSWRTVLDSSNYTSYAMQGAGYSANQNLNTGSTPTFSSIYSSSSGGFYLGDTGAGVYRDNTYDVVLVQNNASGNPLYMAGAGDVIVSIDSNNNETNRKFIVGNNAVKASNELFSVNESGITYSSGGFQSASSTLNLLGGQIYVSAVNSNTLNSGYANADNNSDIWINYRGYSDAQSYYRNFNVGDGRGANIMWAQGSSRRVSINNGQVASYTLHVNGDGYFASTLTVAGTIQPDANGTRDLGTSSLRWSTVYTSDLSMSNGIGDYTIVEGLEDLFLYNNKTNKVFKFMLQEVDPSTATPKKS
jgi:hypothetical protein